VAGAAIVAHGGDRYLRCMSHPMIRAAVLVVLVTVSATARAEPGPTAVSARRDTPGQELSINLFRNPSIGLEYRLGDVSIHLGGYPTKILPKDADGAYPTTWFARTGVSYYFLPAVLFGERASEAYVSGSYLFPLGDGGHAALVDVGYRLMLWRGLNVRLGAALLFERGHSPRLRPTPGIGWSQAF
jgi:hypothetical protein